MNNQFKVTRFRKSGRCLQLILAVIAISLCSFPTQAKRRKKAVQSREQSSDAIKYAQDMIQEGQKRLKRKKYREAIPFFERSQQRVPDVKNLYTLGAIYKKLNNCPKALDYWNQAQARCKECGLSVQIDQALLQHTKACSTKVSIQSLPRAIVLLDGERSGETPYTGRLLIGAHKLELRSQGHIPYVQRLQVKREIPMTLDIVLQPVGQQLGLPTKSLSNPEQDLRNRPLNTLKPSMQDSVPAEEWFKAEKVAKSRSKQTKLQIIMASTGVVMGLSALGLYAYSQSEYNKLQELKASNNSQNLLLADDADNGDLMQKNARFLAVLSAFSLGSLFFID